MATLNGKQVLISTQPSVQKMAQAPTTAPPASTGATPTTTMTSTAMTTAPQVSSQILSIDGAAVAVILKKAIIIRRISIENIVSLRKKLSYN